MENRVEIVGKIAEKYANPPEYAEFAVENSVETVDNSTKHLCGNCGKKNGAVLVG